MADRANCQNANIAFFNEIIFLSASYVFPMESIYGPA